MEPSSLGSFVALEQRDINRLKKYTEAWRFFMGQQWNYSREDGSPLYTDNIVKKIVEDNVTWLVGGGFNFKVPSFFADVVLEKLRTTWERTNDKMTLLLEIAQMASVSGDAFIMVAPVTPTPTQRQMNPYDQTFVRIMLLASECVFPIWNPKNTEELIGVKIVTLYVDPAQLDQNQNGPPTYKKFIQVIYPDRVIEYVEGEAQTTRINPLGEIPLVHIKNTGVAREFFGMSDLDGGVLDLQREYNEKGTDISDTLNYHAHPITVVIGAKVKHLDRGPKKVWSGFPEGAQVFNLEMGGSVQYATEHMDRVREAIREKTGEPKEIEVVSNTSAVALELQFLPMVKRLKRKRPYFEKGLREINYFILRWFQVLEELYLPYGFCENCGGRILETVVLDRVTQQPLRRRPGGPYVTRKRCYHADVLTGQMTDPEEMRLKVIRKLSHGTKRENVERWKLIAEMLGGRSSFWDPTKAAERVGKIESAETWQSEGEKDRDKYQDQKVDVPFTSQPPLPAEDPLMPPTPQPDVPDTFEVDLTVLEYPLEPETVYVLQPVMNSFGLPTYTDSGTVLLAPQKGFFVPTDCTRPVLYNPMNVCVQLNDVLPRDEHLESQLAVQNITSRLWTRERAMERIGIENPDAEMEQIAVEEQEYGAAVPGDQIPRTDLQGMEAERAAAGGDPNKPMPKTAAPSFGKNQGAT